MSKKIYFDGRLNRLVSWTAPFIALIVFFTAVEISLRITGFHSGIRDKQRIKLLFQMGEPLRPVDPTIFGPFEKDLLLFWKLKANPSDGVNERRYRGRLVPYDKPRDTVRIIIIGDSCAYGVLVDEHDTYAHILDNKLNAQGSKRFDVINAGVPGYTSLQGLRYLQSELYKYQPDCVIVGFGFNDLCEAVGFKDKEIPISLFPHWLIRVDNALSNLQSYRLMKQIVFNLRCSFLKRSKYSKRLQVQYAYPALDSIQDINLLVSAQSAQLANAPLRRVPPMDFYENISDIIKLGQKYRFWVILLTLPSINGCFGYAPMLRLIAEKYNIPLVDLIQEFEKRGANTRAFFVDDNHYNPQGHSLIAELLFERLSELGI